MGVPENQGLSWRTGAALSSSTRPAEARQIRCSGRRPFSGPSPAVGFWTRRMVGSPPALHRKRALRSHPGSGPRRSRPVTSRVLLLAVLISSSCSSSPLGVCHAPQDCDGNPRCWRVVNVRNLGTSCEATASGCVPEMGVDTLTNPPLRDGWRLHLRRHHHRADALLSGVGPFFQGMCRGVSGPLKFLPPLTLRWQRSSR